MTDGIKIDISLTSTAKEDEKDGDIDIKTRIAPNENTTEYSIEVNELTGEKEIKPAIEVLPKFKCKKTLDEAEFSSQLSEQEAAINEMNVADWLSNRDSFLARKDMQRKKGRKSVSGRDPKGDKKAKEIRERLLDEYRISLIIENPALEDNEVELERLVKEYGDSRAVLHRVDQIAGGAGTDINEEELGDARVDYSLGAQWRGRRINSLDAKVRELFPGNTGVNVKMNVKLSYVKV